MKAVDDDAEDQYLEDLGSTLSGNFDDYGSGAEDGADVADGEIPLTIDATKFEELQLEQEMIDEMRLAWGGFLQAMGTPLAAGEAIYSVIFEVAPSLQPLFKTPRAVQAMKFMDALMETGRLLDQPAALKTTIETLGFYHLNIEVTEPRVVVYREAILDLLAMETSLSQTARYGWALALNWIGAAFIYIRSEYKCRLDVLASSWAMVSTPEGKDEKDKIAAAEAAVVEDDVEIKDKIQQKIPTTFHEMFLFNAAVMGYGHRKWMTDVLASFDAIVTHVMDGKRLQDECNVLAILLADHKGKIQLSEFSAVMMASLRSLLPQNWGSDHETAWSWLWNNVSFMLKGILGQPAKQLKILQKFYANIDQETLYTFRMDIYSTFFEKCAAGQDYFKQSSTRLHFIVDRIIALTLGIYTEPKAIIDEISALGLRHVGYGIPVDLFGPFVTSCIETLWKLTKDLETEEAFRWSLGLVSRVLVRTIEEGSTIVMRAINDNCSAALKKAVGCAPRGQRSMWVLRIQVGSQSISPLLWAIRSGATDAARAILQDLMTIRADRDNYYYAVDDLFHRHPDIIHSLCVNAPMLLPTLLDGLIWRSSAATDGRRRVHYYIKNLIIEPQSGGLSQSITRLVTFGDPKLICHPAVLLALNLIWTGVAAGNFLRGKAWFIFSLVIFVLCQAIFEPAEIALAHANPPLPPCIPRIIIMVAGRALIYVFILGQLVFHHVTLGFRDIRSRHIKWFGPMPIPQYLARWYEVTSVVLCFVLLTMLPNEPVLLCLGSEDFASATGADRFAYVVHCAEIHGVNHYRYYRYSILSMLAVMLYFILILDMHSFAERLSAFALVCGRISQELLLHLCAFGFLVLSFSCGISSLSHNSADFTYVQDSMVHLFRLALGLWSGEEFLILETDPLLLLMVSVFTLLCTIFFVNVLIAQLNMAYGSTYEDMLGYARLCRGRIILETAQSIKPKRWERFVESLHLEERLEFNEGDLGPAGGIATTEPAMDHPVTVESILRFGGTTALDAPWPEPKEKATDEDKLDRMEKALAKAIRKISHLTGGTGQSSLGDPSQISGSSCGSGGSANGASLASGADAIV